MAEQHERDAESRVEQRPSDRMAPYYQRLTRKTVVFLGTHQHTRPKRTTRTSLKIPRGMGSRN